MCQCNHSSNSSVTQTMNEMDFDRGLWSAALYGNLEEIKRLLKRQPVDVKDRMGYTALHYAARNGHLAICQLLIDNGADVDARTANGQATPLHRAALAGKLDVVELLLKSKADPTAKDVDGKTALHRAAENNHLNICKFLLNIDKNLKNYTDIHNNKPAHYATSFNLMHL